MLNRRQVLSGAAAVVMSEVGPSPAHSVSNDSNGRTVINAIAGYVNLAKGFVFPGDPGNSDSNGYPIKTPTSNWLANPSMPEGYFGDYVWKFHGRGSMQFSPGAIIRSGGANVVGVGGNSGDTGGNTTILDKTNPRVVFAFGAIIQNMQPSPISNGAGGQRIRLTVKPGFANHASSVVRVQGLSGRGQVGASGVWNCIRIDGNTLDLTTSVDTGEVSAWNGEDPYRGSGGEVIWQATNIAVYFLNQGTFSGFGDVVFCKLDNEHLVDSGKIVDPELIEQFRYLKPAWLRFMDLSAVQGSYENDFSRRVPVAHAYYPGSGGRYVPDYWVGSVQRGADDAYACSNPRASGTGAYVDNEIVQGAIDLPNGENNPTLNVNGRGAKYIYDFSIQPRKLRFSGGVPSFGSILTFRFSAPWLNGGSPYDVSYVVGSRKRYSDATFAGLKANLADVFGADAMLIGKVNVGNSGELTLYPITAQMGELSIRYIDGPPGTYCRFGRIDPYGLAAGQNRIRVRLAGTIANNEVLTLNFKRADLPGGIYRLNYVIKFDVDKSLQGLCAGLNVAVNNDATLKAAGISSFPHGLPPNTIDIQQQDTWAGGGLIVSLGSTGLTTAIVGDGGGRGTFIYSYLLDGWIWRPGGILQSVPFEYMVELCNAVNANCWFNWPINTSAKFITDVTNYFRLNLNADLKFGTEVGNEMWNFGQSPWGRAQAKGYCLGFSPGGNNPNYSFTAMRIKQYGELTIAAWTSSRPRAQLYLFNQSATWDLGNANTSQFKGTYLDAVANKIYAVHGGLGGGPTVSYNAYPNRPVDICDALGMAPYWASPWLAGDVNYITGTVSENAPLLQAAKDHALGNFDAAYTALSAQLYGTVARNSAGGGLSLSFYKNKSYPQLESIVASFDSGRPRKMSVIHYEGGPQFGVGNINNGTNDASTDVPGVAARIKALGWNVTAYTISGTDDKTEMAAQIVALIYKFKFSVQYKNLYKRGYEDVVAAHPAREAMGSQYGYDRSQWGLFPRGYSGQHYSSYEAIHEFNYRK